MSAIEDLEKLADLKEKGIITQEEFDTQKKNILEGINLGADGESSAKLSPLGYYKLCWKKYIQFSGRARRSEYWWFWLFNFLIGLLLGFLSGFLGYFASSLGIIFDWSSTVYSLAVLLPSLAVFVRRFHDIGKSAWFAFVPLFIFLGLAVIAIIGLVIDYATIDYTASSTAVSSFLSARRKIFIFGGIAVIITYILWYIVFPCFPSQKGSNKYGPQP